MREDASSKMANNQVSEMPLGEVSRHEAGSSHKRARVSTYADKSRSSCGVRSRTRYGGSENQTDDFLPTWQSNLSRCSGGRNSLPPVVELPSKPLAAKAAGGGSYRGDLDRDREHARNRNRHGDPRSASPTPSYASSSTLSAATTTATTTATALSSRASLSSCRSSFTSSSSSYSSYTGGGRCSGRASHRSGKTLYSSSSGSGSSRSSYSSSSRQVSSAAAGGGSGADLFPKPSSSRSGSVSRQRRGSPVPERRRNGSRDRYPGSASSSSTKSSRDRHFGCPPLGRRSGGSHKDYASEAGSSAGRKRNRSCSRERGRGSSSCSSRRSRSAAESSSGIECARCLERCRYSRAQQGKPITRTLQMDYYVRTPGCKAAKSKHMDLIDGVAYSREQFIEETVFTCPFTGARRDIVLERNMFPYDVPTDMEHWTLWSRKDLGEPEMEAFVQAWATENHPHVVEWECDNNEGDRSIDWFHVHVFFRLGCEDRTGVPRDPASVYDGPYRPKDEENWEEAEEVGEAAAAAATAPTAGGGGGGELEACGGGAVASYGGKKVKGEEAVMGHE